VNANGGTGPYASWIVSRAPDGKGVAFLCAAFATNKNSANSTGWYLGFSQGNFTGRNPPEYFTVKKNS
jgi:hypothetical protein